MEVREIGSGGSNGSGGSSNSEVIVTYDYDPLGRRIAKSVSGKQTSYVYAWDNAIFEMVSDTNLGTSWVTSRIYGNGSDTLLAYETDDTLLPDSDYGEYAFCEERVLPYLSDFTKYGHSGIVERCGTLEDTLQTTERKMFFVHGDHLGSTVALTDASGSVVMEYSYDVYGEPYVKQEGELVSLGSFVGNLHGNDRLFTGREYDGEVGLYYYRARFYDSQDGRFLSPDPVGMADQVNLYAYVGNSPVMYADPSGMVAKQMVKSASVVVTSYGAYAGMRTVEGGAWLMCVVGKKSACDSFTWYAADFYGDSLKWTRESYYYNESKYTQKFKTTSTFNLIKEDIQKKINEWINEPKWSLPSSDNLSLFTLWKFDYQTELKKQDWDIFVNLKITDTYDFNEEHWKKIIDWILNNLHAAQDYWIITPYKTEININYIIWKP